MPKRRRLSSSCSMSNSNRPKASLKINEVWWRVATLCRWEILDLSIFTKEPVFLIRKYSYGSGPCYLRIRIRIQEAHYRSGSFLDNFEAIQKIICQQVGNHLFLYFLLRTEIIFLNIFIFLIK
jgi:hypothetical protein